MKAAKFTFFRRVTAFCPSAALIIALSVLTVAATTTAAQTNVFVPGNASGVFWQPSGPEGSLCFCTHRYWARNDYRQLRQRYCELWRRGRWPQWRILEE
jgi:hypothetical protein